MGGGTGSTLNTAGGAEDSGVRQPTAVPKGMRTLVLGAYHVLRVSPSLY